MNLPANASFSRQGSDTVTDSSKSPRTKPIQYNAFEVLGSPHAQGSAILLGSFQSRSPRPQSTPVWLRDPEPLPTWTPDQQRVLIALLDEQPEHRQDAVHLKRVFGAAHRRMPERTIDEIEECYRHLQAKRIAYFGATTGARGASPAASGWRGGSGRSGPR